MIVRETVKAFERLGFGMFVHFGIYSQLGQGEWVRRQMQIPAEAYHSLAATFCPAEDWAEQLVRTAKEAGCRYITLTTRHHDGYSLYDTRGLSDFDSMHSCGRDLVREFVEACRCSGLLPFFYHTLIDWEVPSYPDNWQTYMEYLRSSVELLCANYGPIGGLWFDGMWAHPDRDWQEDALYGLIRTHQPACMIINNTGMAARGRLGHIELDSVTFERGKPQPINLDDSPKYIASEMCEVLNDHWGYAAEDLNYKSPAQLIRELAECRRYGSNMLLNVGPMGDGRLRPIDREYLRLIGKWVSQNDEAIRTPRPTDIAVVGKPFNFILRDGNNYYLFCTELEMTADANVASGKGAEYIQTFQLDGKIERAYWLDNGEAVSFSQRDGITTVRAMPFCYGRSLVVRVAKLICAGSSIN